MKKLKIIFIALALAITLLWALSLREIPDNINYGVSFSKYHSAELGLDWKEVYLNLLDDLQVRRFRFSAHWPNTEPKNNEFNFSELDFQIQEAKKRNASVIFALGRRLPGWPECHEPEWVEKLSDEEKKEEVLQYIERLVNRYKSFDNIIMWQVENEPFLKLFSKHHCKNFLDAPFLKKEIALVKTLDPKRPVLVTDSGELSTWIKAYKSGDIFGTSVYLYVWNSILGPFRYPLTPGFFRIKYNLISGLLGRKDAILVELSAEPWLLKPIIDTAVEDQLKRMDLSKFNEVIKFASKTGFKNQYLWGAEWWFWLKQNGHEEIWNRAKELF